MQDSHVGGLGGHGGRNHLVAGFHARQDQCSMESRGAGREGNRVGVSNEPAELRLKLFDGFTLADLAAIEDLLQLRHQDFARRKVNFEQGDLHSKGSDLAVTRPK